MTADPATAALTCVVVEDQRMFLQMLVVMLRSLPGLEVVATATTAAEGITACQELVPDLLLLDLTLPDQGGLAVAEALALVNPEARLIVLSADASSFVCPAPLQPMLHAVVDKTRAYGTLSLEIAEIVRQRRAEAGLAAGLAVAEDPLPAASRRLTQREEEIFALIGRGQSNREIAAQLHLSQRTVETHRKNIVAKLGVSGPELVRMAALRLTLQAGGLDLPPPPER